jgi:hypothetical protein
MTDTAVLGHMTVALMERIEKEHGEEAEITAAIVIVNVDHGDGSNAVSIHQESSGIARYEAVGLLEIAKDQILREA